MKSFRTLLERRRDYLKRVGVIASSVRFKGPCTLREYIQRKTGEWHPHIHMFALVDQWIDQQEFSEYWHSLTGDSMVVDVRRARKEKDTAIVKRLPKSVSML